MKFFTWSAGPASLTPGQRRNFINVQVDAVGIGLSNAAAMFLPVFLARLGATNFQVGLLTAMPALTGLVLALLVGRFLQSRRNIVPWFSGARLLVVSAYTLTGIAPFLVPRDYAVPTVLFIWAAVTLPQTVVAVAFSVVMNAVAGPIHRYDLMSRRWSILGLTTAVTVALIGQILDRLAFPINYQLVFMGLSVGGLISFYFSSSISLPDSAPPPVPADGQSWRCRLAGYVNLVRAERPFLAFTARRFVFLSGTALATPLFPLYYVRQVHATDTWIGFINTSQSFVLLLGYFLWARQSKKRGGRFVLLWTTGVVALHPILTALTLRPELLVLYAALAGIFQAGIDLVFFDELMATIPPEYSATFVALAQSLQYMSTIAAPLVGTLLADHIGLGGALMVSALLRLMGFGLFALAGSSPAAPEPETRHRDAGSTPNPDPA